MKKKGYKYDIIPIVLIFLIMVSAFANSSVIKKNERYSIYDDCNEALDDYVYDSSKKEMIIHYHFSSPDISSTLSNNESFSLVEIRNLSYDKIEGKPLLPMKIIKILIPPNTVFDDVQVNQNREVIKLDYRPYIDNNLSHKSFCSTTGMDEFFSDDLYPKKTVDVIGTGKLKGYSILFLKLYPVQYNFTNNELFFSSNISLTLSFNEINQKNDLLRNIPEDRALISTKIDNPSMISYYDSNSPLSSNINDPAIEFVIITNKALEPSFESLVKYKQNYISTAIVNLTFISSNFYGRDLQERIREFIRFAYTNWQTKYVLLGGDISIIPYRGMWGRAIDHEGNILHNDDIPSDLYYAGLDGSWDNDDDYLYGEDIHHSVEDEADFYAEVYVGRAPVETSSEVGTFINKVISYETSEKPERVLLHQSGVNSKNEPDSTVIPEQCAQWIPNHYKIDRLYQTNQTITSDMWMANFENNQLIVEHTGNGAPDRYYLTWPTNAFTTFESMSVLENDFYPIHSSVACNSGAFDKEDCLAETLLLNPYGGASACLFNSRMGFTNSTDAQKYTGEFIEQQFYHIFHPNTRHIGTVNQYAKEELLVDALLFPAYRWCYYTINLLGDPEMPLFEVRQGYLNSSVFFVDDDFNHSTEGWNITHFDTIQKGIDAASNWDIILVKNGIYNERLSIKKTIRLVGEDKEKTIIDGENRMGSLHISADRVKITNFTIKNDELSSDACRILISGSNFVTISNCIISENTNGIYISESKNVFISNNIFRKNDKSIFTSLKTKNIYINENIFSINVIDGFGIYSIGNGYYEIKNNTFTSNLNFYNFTCAVYGNGETNIESNTVYGCSIGLWLYDGNHIIKDNNIFYNRQAGIFVDSSAIIIEGNTVKQNGNNFIGSEYQLDCEPGGIIIYTDYSKKGTINNNDIRENRGFGLYIEGLMGFGNKIANNDFVDNSINAFFRNSYCRWHENYWGKNTLFPKVIFGIYEIGPLLKIPIVQFDIRSSSSQFH